MRRNIARLRFAFSTNMVVSAPRVPKSWRRTTKPSNANCRDKTNIVKASLMQKKRVADTYDVKISIHSLNVVSALATSPIRFARNSCS